MKLNEKGKCEKHSDIHTSLTDLFRPRLFLSCPSQIWIPALAQHLHRREGTTKNDLNYLAKFKAAQLDHLSVKLDQKVAMEHQNMKCFSHSPGGQFLRRQISQAGS